MKPSDKVVAEAVRIEYEDKTGKLFIVFEVKDELYKQSLKRDWTSDIEFRIIDKYLVKND
jgi:hypothetical protein